MNKIDEINEAWARLGYPIDDLQRWSGEIGAHLTMSLRDKDDRVPYLSPEARALILDHAAEVFRDFAAHPFPFPTSLE